MLHWFYVGGPQASPGSRGSVRYHLLVEKWQGGLAEKPGKQVSQQPREGWSTNIVSHPGETQLAVCTEDVFQIDAEPGSVDA